MLKKIVLIVIAALVIAAAAYLFSVYTVYDTSVQTEVVTLEKGEVAYAIKFTDPDGKPVSGVMANVCDDTACTMLTSDEEGLALFAGEEKAWSVQILKVPEGFVFVKDEKIPLNADGETVIVLNKE